METDKALYEAVLNTVSDGIWVTDPDDRITYCNDAMEQIAGVGADQIIGLSVQDDFPEKTTGQFLLHYRQAREGLVPVAYEAGVVTPSGRPTQQTGSLTPRVLEGRFAGMICTVRDVTEPLAAETALRESEAKYRRLAENMPAVVFQCMMTDEGAFSFPFVSRSVVDIIGVSAEDVMRDAWALLGQIHPDDTDAFLAGVTRSAAALAPYREAIRWLKNGEERWVDVRSLPTRCPHGTVWDGVFIDITERCKAEQERETMRAQLLQARKLQSIGTLASGIAHEINNPIMGIMNYAQLIQDSIGVDSPATEYAAEISNETERVATIVKNLLSFARLDDEQQPSSERVCDIVEVTLSLIGVMLRRDQIMIDLNIPEDLPAVKCRSQQIQQVLMALLTNARDALNEKYPRRDANKKIIIQAEAGRRNSEGIWKTTNPPSDNTRSAFYVRLTIEDSGTGIPKDIQGRIFDPFFTTKPCDKGTGLGLAISHGIVTEHRGVMSVESTPNGTRFLIELPLDCGA